LATARDQKIEKGRKVRIDCTCVESNIHHPTDSNVALGCRSCADPMMEQCRHDGVKIPGFHNHSRVAKRRMLAMINAKRKKARKAAYVDLIKTTGKVTSATPKGLLRPSTPCPLLICVL
jgi:IS5 family transposase